MATPGEKIKIWAQTKPNVEVNFTVSNLGATKAKAKDRANSKGIAVIEFTVPSTDGCGYLVDAEAGGGHAYTGIDASKSWTRYPITVLQFLAKHSWEPWVSWLRSTTSTQCSSMTGCGVTMIQ